MVDDKKWRKSGTIQTTRWRNHTTPSSETAMRHALQLTPSRPWPRRCSHAPPTLSKSHTSPASPTGLHPLASSYLLFPQSRCQRHPHQPPANSTTNASLFRAICAALPIRKPRLSMAADLAVSRPVLHATAWPRLYTGTAASSTPCPRHKPYMRQRQP
jgi:hypothetical protein